MKKTFLPVLLLLTLILFSLSAYANVQLPAIFGSHMVLQQNSTVKIWGWSEPGEKINIKVDWDTTTYTTSASGSARWKLTLKTPSAGGPHTITINGRNTIELQDVLIGEVWLCSGQSNMEMNINWGMKQYGADVTAAENNKSIRFFQVQKTTAEYPQDDLKGQWVVCDSNSMKGFSTAGYFFGSKLNEQLNIPVGLINSSWGGTSAEVWTPKELIENNPVLKKDADQRNPANSTGWPVSPGFTFNAMIAPITNYNIAGVIWYQGEANVGKAANYPTVFTTMIGAWRKAWQKDFPFYFVQIAPFTYGNNINAPLLREAQTKSLAYPNTGMVVIHDLVDDVKDIHPKQKKEVGLRLADLALSRTYNKRGLAFRSPEYQGLKIEKSKIRIYFNNADNGLVSKGGALTEFYIAGSDKVFVPATAKIDGNNVVVSSKEVENPLAVRFGFTNTSMPNLFSKEGLPVNIFRTDDWVEDAVK